MTPNHILIVDNEPTAREIPRLFFELEGSKASVAAKGFGFQMDRGDLGRIFAFPMGLWKYEPVMDMEER
jgi:hypothetical protein